jgi:sterol 24-C-methyltransferase
LDWVQLPKYDPNNPHHAELMRRIKPLIGAIGTPTPEEFGKLLKEAGFNVLVSEEPSVNAHQGPLIDKASNYYDLISGCIKFLVKTRIVPKHFDLLFERLSRDGDSLIEAEQLGLVTTSYHIIAQKPFS